MSDQQQSKSPTLSFECFDNVYRALTGHDGACRWQHRLFTELEAGRFPTDVELATGLGKTSVIALWVLALGRALARQSTAVPRRLTYVVDRRVVVDQASEFAEEVRRRLELAAEDEEHALHEIATTLKAAGCTSSVVEVSTLRGQRALDPRWRNDPTRPAIIVGTVDMIGPACSSARTAVWALGAARSRRDSSGKTACWSSMRPICARRSPPRSQGSNAASARWLRSRS